MTTHIVILNEGPNTIKVDIGDIHPMMIEPNQFWRTYLYQGHDLVIKEISEEDD